MAQFKDPEVRPGAAEQRPAVVVWEELYTCEHQVVGRVKYLGLNPKIKMTPTALYRVLL